MRYIPYFIVLLLKFFILFIRIKIKSYRSFRIALSELRKGGLDEKLSRELARLAAPELRGVLNWMNSGRSKKYYRK
jgi:hypothetical protein